MQNTDLTGADLRFAELKKAVCEGTIFSKSRLFKANFEAARIEAAKFVDVEIGNSSLIKILKLANIKSVLVNFLDRKDSLIAVNKGLFFNLIY